MSTFYSSRNIICKGYKLKKCHYVKYWTVSGMSYNRQFEAYILFKTSPVCVIIGEFTDPFPVNIGQ